MAERNNIEFAWLALIAAAAVTVGAFLPPILSETAAARVMIAYSFVCHQLPDRSPSINGVPIAICYRCTGIYFGLIFGSLIYPWVHRHAERLHRNAVQIIAASLAVPGIDWLGDVFGLWTNTAASRVLMGAVFGMVAGLYFARATIELRLNRLGLDQVQGE